MATWYPVIGASNEVGSTAPLLMSAWRSSMVTSALHDSVSSGRPRRRPPRSRAPGPLSADPFFGWMMTLTGPPDRCSASRLISLSTLAFAVAGAAGIKPSTARAAARERRVSEFIAAVTGKSASNSAAGMRIAAKANWGLKLVPNRLRRVRPAHVPSRHPTNRAAAGKPFAPQRQLVDIVALRCVFQKRRGTSRHVPRTVASDQSEQRFVHNLRASSGVVLHSAITGMHHVTNMRWTFAAHHVFLNPAIQTRSPSVECSGFSTTRRRTLVSSDLDAGRPDEKARTAMRRSGMGIAGALLVATGITVHGSSHREALSILNEPCADNTDTYTWVSNGLHDKLYLIMDFNPLHEPGQGNQGLRACDGYRYEFHIAKGASLKDKVVYRVEFKKRLSPEAAPSLTDPLGGGNELLWQLTGGTETMKVSRIMADGSGSGRGEGRGRAQDKGHEH